MKLKVYGVDWCGKFRRIVAARSQKEAAVLFGTTLCHFRDYGSQTFNEEEVALAMSETGAIWERTNNFRVPADWRKVK